MRREEQWKNLREAESIMKDMRKEMRELDKMMSLAWKEVCQPAK